MVPLSGASLTRCGYSSASKTGGKVRRKPAAINTIAHMKARPRFASLALQAE